jgi:hypothetical protein
METHTTETLKRPFNIILLTLLGIFIFLSAFQKQHWDTDIFWALRAGEWIIENLEVPKSDPFSYTFQGEPWIDFTWGFQVMAHLFYTYLGGWYGIFFLQLLVTSLTFYLIYLNLKLLTSGRVSLCICLLFLVYFCSYHRFFIRPHLFAYLFISLYLLFLNLYVKKGQSRFLYLLLPLQVLWVNIHSSFVLGIFMAGVYALSAFVDEAREKGLGAEISPKLKRLIFISLLLPVFSLVNPYGWKLAVFPFIHQGGENAEALRHIGEWTKIPLNELLFYLYPFPLHYFAFKLLVIGAALSLVMNYRRANVRDTVLLAAAFYLAATHTRWVAQFAYFAAPVLALSITQYLEAREQNPVTFRRAFYGLTVLTAALFPYSRRPCLSSL